MATLVLSTTLDRAGSVKQRSDRCGSLLWVFLDRTKSCGFAVLFDLRVDPATCPWLPFIDLNEARLAEVPFFTAEKILHVWSAIRTFELSRVVT